jgi:hypothetical protein
LKHESLEYSKKQFFTVVSTKDSQVGAYDVQSSLTERVENEKLNLTDAFGPTSTSPANGVTDVPFGKTFYISMGFAANVDKIETNPNVTIDVAPATYDEKTKFWSSSAKDVVSIKLDKINIVGTGSDAQVEVPALQANKTYCVSVPAGLFSASRNVNVTNKAIAATPSCEYFFSTIGSVDVKDKPKPVMLAHYPTGKVAGGFKEMHLYFNQKVALNTGNKMGVIQSTKQQPIVASNLIVASVNNNAVEMVKMTIDPLKSESKTDYQFKFNKNITYVSMSTDKTIALTVHAVKPVVLSQVFMDACVYDSNVKAWKKCSSSFTAKLKFDQTIRLISSTYATNPMILKAQYGKKDIQVKEEDVTILGSSMLISFVGLPGEQYHLEITNQTLSDASGHKLYPGCGARGTHPDVVAKPTTNCQKLKITVQPKLQFVSSSNKITFEDEKKNSMPLYATSVVVAPEKRNIRSLSLMFVGGLRNSTASGFVNSVLSMPTYRQTNCMAAMHSWSDCDPKGPCGARAENATNAGKRSSRQIVYRNPSLSGIPCIGDVRNNDVIDQTFANECVFGSIGDRFSTQFSKGPRDCKYALRGGLNDHQVTGIEKSLKCTCPVCYEYFQVSNDSKDTKRFIREMHDYDYVQEHPKVSAGGLGVHLMCKKADRFPFNNTEQRDWQFGGRWSQEGQKRDTSVPTYYPSGNIMCNVLQHTSGWLTAYDTDNLPTCWDAPCTSKPAPSIPFYNSTASTCERVAQNMSDAYCATQDNLDYCLSHGMSCGYFCNAGYKRVDGFENSGTAQCHLGQLQVPECHAKECPRLTAANLVNGCDNGYCLESDCNLDTVTMENTQNCSVKAAIGYEFVQTKFNSQQAQNGMIKCDPMINDKAESDVHWEFQGCPDGDNECAFFATNQDSESALVQKQKCSVDMSKLPNATSVVQKSANGEIVPVESMEYEQDAVEVLCQAGYGLNGISTGKKQSAQAICTHTITSVAGQSEVEMVYKPDTTCAKRMCIPPAGMLAEGYVDAGNLKLLNQPSNQMYGEVVDYNCNRYDAMSRESENDASGNAIRLIHYGIGNGFPASTVVSKKIQCMEINDEMQWRDVTDGAANNGKPFNEFCLPMTCEFHLSLYENGVFSTCPIGSGDSTSTQKCLKDACEKEGKVLAPDTTLTCLAGSVSGGARCIEAGVVDQGVKKLTTTLGTNVRAANKEQALEMKPAICASLKDMACGKNATESATKCPGEIECAMSAVADKTTTNPQLRRLAGQQYSFEVTIPIAEEYKKEIEARVAEIKADPVATKEQFVTILNEKIEEIVKANPDSKLKALPIGDVGDVSAAQPTVTFVVPPAEEDDGLSGGAIAGIVVGSIVFVALMGVGGYFMCAKK